ncbi:2,4-dienoyl-CoA reductase [Christensenellaceae bacterium OttesenSCG-928-K19]|nr:2,4-dienoyl-CoA reductase [Christensenellaceae bacterium OttesenSCG-928-K19]
MSQEALFSPIKIGSKTAPNRIVINSMECCDALDNGDPSPKTYERYENLFKGQPGVIIGEAITPQYDHISREHQLSIKEHNVPALKKFVAHLKEINPDVIYMPQVTHSGEISHPRFSSRIRVTEEPLPGYENSTLVREKEIEQVIQDYVDGARRCYEIGADGVDLKLCHGYLGTQILRPYNKDNWKYGGAWENRRQFAIDVYDRVREAVPDENFLIGSKISVYEGFPGGVGTLNANSACMDLTETIDLVQQLEKHGMQWVLQSAGSPSHTLDLAHPDKKSADYAYMHFYFQKVLRDALKPETVVMGSGYTIYRDGNVKVGGNKKAFQAVLPENNSVRFWGNKNINDGVVDAISIGRQSFADQFTPQKMMENRDKEIKWCTLCDHCVELLIQQYNVGCATYDKRYTEIYKQMVKETGGINEKHT